MQPTPLPPAPPQEASPRVPSGLGQAGDAAAQAAAAARAARAAHATGVVVAGGGGGGGAVLAPVVGAPNTREEYQALVSRRNELSDQLRSAQGRRDRLVRELRSAPPDAQGIQARIAQLDQRILGLENDISTTGQQIAAAPAWALPASTVAEQPRLFGVFTSDQATGISIVFTILVLFPLAFARARAIWKRASHPSAPAGWNDAQQRIQRMEQAVDVIAVEVERVSESQRFLTKVLTEPGAGAGAAGVANGAARAIGAPAMEPVPVAEQEKERVRRQ